MISIGYGMAVLYYYNQRKPPHCTEPKSKNLGYSVIAFIHIYINHFIPLVPTSHSHALASLPTSCLVGNSISPIAPELPGWILVSLVILVNMYIVIALSPLA